MATYCTDADLVKYRPNIMELGVESWETQREEAYAMINRVVIARWYRKVAEDRDPHRLVYDYRVTEFDPDKVEDGYLTRLEVFKTLELAYMYLKKEGAEADGFERLEEQFRRRYTEELEMILSVGINYDWDGDDIIDDQEKYIYRTRRLVRG
mgnify:CR=1 FL=1|jgi:hypothetical protein